jgi:hypothetical protein
MSVLASQRSTRASVSNQLAFRGVKFQQTAIFVFDSFVDVAESQ